MRKRTPTDKSSNVGEGGQSLTDICAENHPPIADTDYNEEYCQWYCLQRTLYRPKLNLLSFTAIALAALAAGLLAGYAVWLMFGRQWNLKTTLWVAAMLTVVVNMRMLVIGLVRLYQHYAPEQMRRSCMLVPTCSEYCIMALRKYGVVKGCYKTMHRLLHTCKGWTYHTDWP